MSQGGGGSSKPKGMGREEIVTLARRPPRHSSLFWYLFDQHDELIEAKKLSGLGIPWESMLPLFAALNLTLWKGKAITLRGAEQTFLRVQKKKARLAAPEAKAEAERIAAEAKTKLEDFVARRTKTAESKIALAEAQAVADVRSAAANAAVTAASTILSQSVKGGVADDLLAKGIAEVRQKLN